MPSQTTRMRQQVIRQMVYNRVRACGRCFGRYRVLWMDLTLLPSDPQHDVTFLTRLWNKLNSAFFQRSPEIVGWLRVVEARSRSGALHIHGLLVTRCAAIRPAFPSELAQRQKNPWSLNAYGQALGREFARLTAKCRFGISNLEPIKTNFTAVGLYLGKSFNADVFSHHPFLLGAQRFRASAKLTKIMRSKNWGFPLKSPVNQPTLSRAVPGSNLPQGRGSGSLTVRTARRATGPDGRARG